jgi:hypothetical protein
MKSTLHAFVIAVLLSSASAQTVTATATGFIACSESTTASGTMTQSLPPGSPLPNGTAIATSLSSVFIGLLLNPAPGTAARYSISESSSVYVTSYPPFHNDSGATSCQTVLALTANPPTLLRVLCSWTHSPTALFLPPGTGSVIVDIGNDGTLDWQPDVRSGLTTQATFFVFAGATPALIGTRSNTYANYFPLGAIATWSSQLVIDVSPSPPPRCTATSYSTACGAALSMMDLGAGSMQFTGEVLYAGTRSAAMLVLGLQQQTSPLPFSANCFLLVVPFATSYSANGSPWLLGPPPPLPGTWTFDVQTVHLGLALSQLVASNPLQVTCQ